MSKWNGDFAPTGPTDQSGPVPEVVPNIPFDFRPNVPEYFSMMESTHVFMVSSMIPKPLWCQRKYGSQPVLGDSAHLPPVHGEMFHPLREFQSRDFTGLQ